MWWFHPSRSRKAGTWLPVEACYARPGRPEANQANCPLRVCHSKLEWIRRQENKARIHLPQCNRCGKQLYPRSQQSHGRNGNRQGLEVECRLIAEECRSLWG